MRREKQSYPKWAQQPLSQRPSAQCPARISQEKPCQASLPDALHVASPVQRALMQPEGPTQSLTALREPQVAAAPIV